MTVVVRMPPEHQAFGILSCLLGAGFGLGGPERAISPAFSIVNELGGPFVWGAVFGAIGVTMILSGGGNLLMRELLLVGFVAHWVLAAVFMVAAVQDSSVTYVAMVLAGWAAALHFCAWKREWRKASESAGGTTDDRC